MSWTKDQNKAPWEAFDIPAPWDYRPRQRSDNAEWQAEQEKIISDINDRIDERGCGGTTMEDLEEALPQYPKKSLRIAVFSHFDTLYYKSKGPHVLLPRGVLYIQPLLKTKV